MPTVRGASTSLSQPRESGAGGGGGGAGLSPGPAARSPLQLLHQLAGALRFAAGRLQQSFPKRVPAFLLTRFCPLQAAEVLVFLLKVSAKLGHPGAPTLRIIVIGPGEGRETREGLMKRQARFREGESGSRSGSEAQGSQFGAGEHITKFEENSRRAERKDTISTMKKAAEPTLRLQRLHLSSMSVSTQCIRVF